MAARTLCKEGCLSRLFALIYQASEPAVEPESLRSMIQFRLAEGIQGLVHCRPCSFFFLALLRLEHWRRQSPTVLDRDPVLETVAFHELAVVFSLRPFLFRV